MKTHAYTARRTFLRATGWVRRGDTLELTEQDAADLGPNLVTPAEDATPPVPAGSGQTFTTTDDKLPPPSDAPKDPPSHEDVERDRKAAEDARLAPYAKKGGWYHFGTGETVVKVQGREAALAELEAQRAADTGGNTTPS